MLSVVIPTYKNKKQLIENLDKNERFLPGCQIIVVNDDPVGSLKGSFDGKNITLIENKANYGFAETMNRGVAQARYPYVMFLNDDVLLGNDDFRKALESFKKDKNLFAVSFAQKEKDNTIVGKNGFFWKRGFFHHHPVTNLQKGHNAWAEGGACVIDKAKFERIGGFDPIFKPFYWEDIDLSYRAWRRGYSILFDPSVVVTHHHESTIGTHFSKHVIREIAFRNQHIFILKNIGDRRMLVEYMLFLPFNMIYYVFKGEWRFITGFSKVIFSLKKIIRQRKKTQEESVVADRNILKMFK